MAVVVKPFGVHDEGRARVDVRYQDAVGQRTVLGIIPVNTGTGILRVILKTPAGATVLDEEYPPGSEERVLTAGEAQQLSIGISSKGNLTGVSIETLWTAPGA